MVVNLVKRLIYIGIIALFASLLVASFSVSASSWLDDRETIEYEITYCDEGASAIANVTFEYYEKDNSTIWIDNPQWEVLEKIIVNNANAFNLTNVNISIDVPSHFRDKDMIHDYVNISLLEMGENTSILTIYKLTPTEPTEEDISGTTLIVDSPEDLDECVFWEFDPQESDYENFASLNEDTEDLVITLNDDELEHDDDENDNSWYWDDDIIIFENLTLEDGDNEFEFTWAGQTTTPTTPVNETGDEDEEEEEPFYMKDIQGVPAYIIILFLTVIVAIVVIASKK